MVDQISPYIFKKRRAYYFSRRVPVDLKKHYKRPRIVLSLRTRSLNTAKLLAISMAAKLEEDRMVLRWRTSDNPLSRFVLDRAPGSSTSSTAPFLSAAKELYLKAKGNNRQKTFHQLSSVKADAAASYILEIGIFDMIANQIAA